MNGWKAIFTKSSVVIIMTMVIIMVGLFIYVLGVAEKAEQASIQAKTATAQNKQLAHKNADLIEKIDQESRERRDQGCRGLELQHLQEIRALEHQYDYYVDPPPEFKNLLNDPRSIQSLLDSEKDARKDTDRFGAFVPPYCDHENFGLPEPDPLVPSRPAKVERLLRGQEEPPNG